MRVILQTCLFKLLEVTAYLVQKNVAFLYCGIIGLRCVGKNIGLVPIYVADLTAQGFSVFLIRLVVDVEANQGGIRHGEHIVKAKKTKFAIIKLKNMTPRTDIYMVGLSETP